MLGQAYYITLRLLLKLDQLHERVEFVLPYQLYLFNTFV